MACADRARTLRVVAGPTLRRARSLLHGVRRGAVMHKNRPGQPFSIQTGTGHQLSALLYPAQQGSEMTAPPGLIVLHGSDPLGQRHALYVALARALQRRGLTVLTVNLRGYPGSAESAADETFTMEAFVDDAGAALAALEHSGQVDVSRVALYGHSYGAGIVAPALAADVGFWKGVVHSPPDWNGRRITADSAPEQALFHERFWRYMRRPHPVSLSTFLALSRSLDLLNQLEALSRVQARILLITGGAEGESMRTFVQTVQNSLPKACTELVIAGADHYCNTAPVGKWAFVDRAALDSLSGGLVTWLTEGLVP